MPLACSQFDLKESKEIYEEFQLLKLQNYIQTEKRINLLFSLFNSFIFDIVHIQKAISRSYLHSFFIPQSSSDSSEPSLQSESPSHCQPACIQSLVVAHLIFSLPQSVSPCSRVVEQS